MATKVNGVKQKPVETAGTEAGARAVTVERRVVACNAQFITVDAGKLSKGLKTTFEGVEMVFDSIGVPVQLGLTMDLENENEDEGIAEAEATKTAVTADQTEPAVATEKVAVKKKVKAESKAEPEPSPVVDTQEDEAPVEETASATEESVAEPEPVVEQEAKEAPAEVTSSITIDDITKIIVQKIKQNRKNNEKIGAILKTYEVARVGDLHPSKYEAFLTDLSAI